MKYISLIRRGMSFFVAPLVIISMTFFAFPSTIFAASLTSFSVTMEREKASTASNQDIRFVTPTGLASTQTIILTYNNTGTPYSTFNFGSVAFGDIDLQEGSSSNCSTATWSDKTLVASGPSSSQFSAAVSGGNVLTFTSGGTSATITAGRCVRILIGTNAAGGTNKITNGLPGSGLISVTGTFGDTGSVAIPIISDDQVVVNATVYPTIAFTISSNAVDFGVLSYLTANYAKTGATSGGWGSTDNAAGGTTLTVGTNAVSGYTLTYIAPTTLTDGTHSLTAANITDDADGTPGNSEFGIDLASSAGTPTIASGYDHGGTPDWHFATATTTQIASNTVPTTDSAIVHYIANIPLTQAPGSYSVAITYIATGNF